MAGDDSTFGRCATAHHEGLLTLAEFFRRTNNDVTKMAQDLLNRWPTPVAVDVEDVAQEIRIGCCWAFKRFDPTHPGAATVAAYVRWNSIDKAKKWVHRQRGAKLHGSVDRNKSRYAVLYEDVARHRFPNATEKQAIELLSELRPMDSDQEDSIDLRQRWRDIFAAAPSRRIAWAVLALHVVSGEQVRAAEIIYSDPRLRLRLRLGSPEAAQELVGDAIHYMGRVAA